jgi:peptidoglycan/xylan/chitin deacetylase (PgdA/CDA1 family)
MEPNARADALAQLHESVAAGAPPSGPGPEPERELLSWDELARMASGGFDVESHGTSHALLPQLDAAQADAELRCAREALLERGFGGGALLAWPSGAHDSRTRERARTAGYRAAFSVAPGLAASCHDAMAYPRIGLHEDISGSRAEFLRVVPGFGLRPEV